MKKQTVFSNKDLDFDENPEFEGQPDPDIVDPQAEAQASGTMGNIASDTLSAIGNTIDRVGAGWRKGTAAVKEGGLSEFPGQATKGFVSPESAPNVPEWMDTMGIPGSGNPIAEFAVDATLGDPLMLAGGLVKGVDKGIDLVRGADKVASLAKSRAYGQLLKKARIGADTAVFRGMEAAKPELSKLLTLPEVDALKNNPTELKKFLTGKTVGLEDAAEAELDNLVDGAEEVVSGGKLGETAREVDSIIKEASRTLARKGEYISSDDVIRPVIEKIRGKKALPGTGVDKGEFARLEQIVQKYIAPIEIGEARPVTLSDLQSLKKELGKNLTSRHFTMPADALVAKEKEILTDMYHAVKDRIEKEAGKIYAGTGRTVGDLIREKNRDMRAMYVLDKAVTKDAIKQTKMLSEGFPVMSAVKAGGKTAVGAAGATGAFGPGAQSVGAAGGALWAAPDIKAMRDYARFSPAFPEAGKMAQTGLGLEASLRQLSRDRFSDPSQQQEQSGNYNMSRINSVMSSRLPRYTEFALENKDLLLSKLQLQAPELVQGFEDALRVANKDQLSVLLGKMADKRPDLFVHDKYNRWDDKFVNDLDQQRYINEVRKSGGRSIERAKALMEATKNKRIR